MMWPGWSEPLVCGPGEGVAVAIAHGIVLGIAWVRFRLTAPAPDPVAQGTSCPRDAQD